MTSVVTVTAAAAIDLTYTIGGIRPGEVNRALESHRELSGKGVNVARALDLAGVDVVGVVALGEHEAWMAPADDTVLRAVLMAGSTRINTTLLEPNGSTTKINESAPPLAASGWAALRDTALDEVRRRSAEWLVIAGTLPQLAGSGADVPIAELTAAAAAFGARVVVDTSGAALRDIAAHPAGVTLLKPNTHELAELVGRELGTIGSVIEAARGLLGHGLELLYVSMGADGAIVVSETAAVHAHAVASRVRNTAGAGDASLAGFIAGGSSGSRAPIDLAAAARRAAEFGALSVSQDTTVLHSLHTAPTASVTARPDVEQPLSEPATP
jgi:1-phosphofructokinase